MKEKDEEREYRIDFEIIVDCYDEEEVKMGWFSYMEDNLNFPFQAEAPIKKRKGEKVIQKVEVLELTSDEDFGSDMKVGVSYNEDVFEVPLLSLTKISADESTIQAIEDWRYWNL